MEIVLNFDEEEVKELEKTTGGKIGDKEGLCQAVRAAIDAFLEKAME